LLTGSLGLLSEAAHSLLDLGAAGLTYIAVRVSDKPADERHPYGHGKIESVSALAETMLLFATAAWIIREAVLRLMEPLQPVETTWYAVAVVIVSIAIDLWRSRTLMRVAKETRSQALEADALHFATDILSSAVVLLGLGAVALGYPKGDAMAAIGVACFVVHVGYRLGKRTIDVLIDSAPDGISLQVEEIARRIDGVASIDRVRVRPAGATTHVEVLIRVARTMPLDRVQQVCDAVASAVDARIPGGDAFVKAEPLALDDESILDTVHVIAGRRGVLVHAITIDTVEGQRHVSFDIEVDETMNIVDAHEVATGVEAAMREELGEDVLIETHIDPRRDKVLAGQPLAEGEFQRLAAVVVEAAQTVGHVFEAHGVHIRHGDVGLYVSLHCLFRPDLSVRLVHDATDEVEQRIRECVRGVGRVVVHAEPLEGGV
jgi:cation diffusion facilitator family transporter